MKVKRLIEMLQDVDQETNVYAYLSNKEKGWKFCDIELVGKNEDITLLSVPFEDKKWMEWKEEQLLLYFTLVM